MRNLRRQSIKADRAFDFHLAADARTSRTDYVDDQAWVLRMGARDEAALAFQTQFGGRAGLVSLAPMWGVESGVIYQQLGYAREPEITYFAADMIQVEAAPIEDLEMIARFWAMDSRAAGGEFNLVNYSAEHRSLQLDLFGHVVINGRRQKLNVLTMADYSLALHLGEVGNLNPVVTLEGASVEVYGGRISSPKIGCLIELAPGASRRIPFVVAGLADMRDSYSVAMNWMSRPWAPYFEQIDGKAAAIPKISTGDSAWDFLIDHSAAQLIKSLMNPTDHLPHHSLVAYRCADRGWSRRGDGSDHVRAWSGQDPTYTYPAVLALAGIDRELAKGIVRNYFAASDETGFIDRRPGLGGQRQGVLQMPILVRLCLTLVEETDDRDFAREALPALRAFFARWLSEDADGDGAPEWQSERQMGYIAFPTFGRGQAWAQGASPRQLESPDLLAYLISEADSLRQLAELIGERETADFAAEQLRALEEHLEAFWDGERYVYRDRDSHTTSAGIDLVYRGAGDQAHEIGQELANPARVIVRVVGGVTQRPRITMRLEGKDQSGADILVEASVDDFLWQNRQGVFITPKPLSQVERLAIKGLSRVYKVYARTLDSSRLDINALLPLWSGRLSPARAAALLETALDESRFLRPNGLTMVSADDRNYDPSSARGGGGIWIFWLTLICEGLLKAGYRQEATEIAKRLLDALSRVLARDGRLAQFYHADEAKGFGEEHHLAGIAPLKLLSDVIGISIIAADQVWVGGEFTWGHPVTVEQHGVTVTRSAAESRVEFPSGQTVSLGADAPWQLVQDPTPQAPAPTAVEPLDAPGIPMPSEEDVDGPVSIEVEDGADTISEAPPGEPDAPAPESP
ncbi:MAG: hypothetical protein F4X02_15560 [Chloroflexi bacterium]|nr:hypothetical protein [Chloroflexota bacterium]